MNLQFLHLNVVDVHFCSTAPMYVSLSSHQSFYILQFPRYPSCAPTFSMLSVFTFFIKMRKCFCLPQLSRYLQQTTLDSQILSFAKYFSPIMFAKISVDRLRTIPQRVMSFLLKSVKNLLRYTDLLSYSIIVSIISDLFLDLTKTFDSGVHKQLLDKLEYACIRGIALDLR